MAILNGLTIPRKCEVPQGAYGIWQIPALEIMMPVYQASGYGVQKVIDDEESAAMFKYGVGRIIADHAESSYHGAKKKWQIGRVTPDTAAFFVRPNGKVEKYVCNQVMKVGVHSNGYTLDGAVIYPRLATDIICSCCTDEGSKSNYWAIFKYKGVMP